MRRAFMVLLLFLPSTGFCVEKADFVLVVKSENTLYLKNEGRVIHSFHVVFGANPRGHKLQQGDERTPEGKYVLDYKKKDSSFYKSIHISYPNEQDKRRARALQVQPGGLIMIHGQKNGFAHLWFISRFFNWTDGCIALSNSDMDHVWQAIDVGTPIEILP